MEEEEEKAERKVLGWMVHLSGSGLGMFGMWRMGGWEDGGRPLCRSLRSLSHSLHDEDYVVKSQAYQPVRSFVVEGPEIHPLVRVVGA